MTKADIVEQVSEATGLTKVETEAVVDGVIFYIKDSLQRGERVDMRGFGSFFSKEYKGILQISAAFHPDLNYQYSANNEFEVVKKEHPRATLSTISNKQVISWATDDKCESIILFAFLGGLILNIMPCVFPILSLKVLSILEKSMCAVIANFAELDLKG